MRSTNIFALAVVLGIIVVSSSLADIRYDITEIPNSTGYDVMPQAISSDTGQVVGRVKLGLSSTPYRPFSWHIGDADVVNCGSLYGGDGEALAVSNTGRVTGWTKTSYNHRMPFLWENPTDGMRQSFQNLGGNNRTAEDFTSNGLVAVGYAQDTSGTYHAVRWTWDPEASGGSGGYNVEALPDLNGTPAWAGACGINNNGMIVGSSRYSDNYKSQAFITNGATVTPLGFLPGENKSYASKINNAGLIIGYAGKAGKESAVYWDPGTHAIHDIGNFSTNPQYSKARGLNESSQIVGYSYDDDSQRHAFLFENGTLKRVHDLIPDSEKVAWSMLNEASAVDESGRIVGWGTYNGDSFTGFLLTPVYFDNGDFDGGTLDGWTTGGAGSADVSEGTARLTAGSEITITQQVATPDGWFDLGFDYEFLTTDASAALTVTLGGEVLVVLDAPDSLVGDFTTHVILVTDAGLRGQDLDLTFGYDGPSGSQCLLDNITITQVIPEPATLSLLTLGGVMTLLRRRRK